MKTLIRKYETAMVAATFAEAGEFDTARLIMREDRPRKNSRPSVHDYRRPGPRKEMRAN